MKKNLGVNALFLFFSALIVLCPSCSGNEKDGGRQMDRAAYYNDMIKHAVSVTPDRLGLELPGKEKAVYGVITLQNVANLLVVVSAAYGTGEAVEMVFFGNSFVLPGDGGLSSGICAELYDNAKKYLKYYERDIKKYWEGQSDLTLSQNLLMTMFAEKSNKEIKNKIKDFIASSQKYLDYAGDSDAGNPLPGAGEIKIIFLTGEGGFAASVPVSEISDSPLFPLFKARSDISTEIFGIYAPPKPEAGKGDIK